MHRPGEPRRERLPEALEAGRGKCEQAGPVVGAVERDDARLPGDEETGAEGDLDGVLSGDAQHHVVPSEPELTAKLGSDVGFCEVAERMDATGGLTDDRFTDLEIPVTERSDPEPTGQVEKPAPVPVDDSATLGFDPRHSESRPLRPGRKRRAVAFAIAVAMAGFSWSRRTEYSYQRRPNGT